MAVQMKASSVLVEYVDINDLQPHPRNVEIYGEENVPTLIKKIKYSNWIKPLVVSQHNRIISGHSRWKAARSLEYTQVPVERRIFADEIEELEALLLENVSRVKTNMQVANEGKSWEYIFGEINNRTQEAQGPIGKELGSQSTLTVLARGSAKTQENAKPLGANLRQGVAPDNSSTPSASNKSKKQRAPKTSEQAAQAVGKKTRNYEKMASVRDSIEKLGKTGKPEEAKVLEILLNKSVDGAYQLADLEKPDNLAILAKIANKEAKDVKEAKKLVKKEKIEQLHKKVDGASDVSEAKEREIQTGQLWKLGKHLLYCGDSSTEDFQQVAKKAEVSLAFADPPYNAGVDDWDVNFEWKHDYLADMAPIVAVTPGISAIKDFMCVTQMSYKWSMAYWLDNGMARGPLGFGKWIYVALFSKNSIYRNKPDFGRVSISSSEWDGDGVFDHKGRKPLSMMFHLIETLTEEDDIILDPFLGTGTTLAVCEQSKRVCIGAEINPEYCKGIIQRWEKLSEQQAEEVTNGMDALFS